MAVEKWEEVAENEQQKILQVRKIFIE